jgi:hypothetical protein
MFKYKIWSIIYMNSRFRRLRKNPSRPDAPLKTMPFAPLVDPAMIDDWLRRDRQRKDEKWKRGRPEVRLPLQMPFDQPPEDKRESGDSTIKPTIIDIKNPDNAVN